ncbi:MAG TPA: DNA repair protein RecN [Dissulfurispiraceae bacterium]|nr:DNA repair protein RecN [Dissulfurispiraceae bacterium]
MLRELRIKDFTIIDDLSIVFQPGLNVLTGETGAGKSIIVDALGVLLGDKASQDFIRTGSSEARIEATFDPADIPLLSEIGVDGSEGIILRRITGKGKGRAYINDTPVSLASIAAVGSGLVDIHGQHEHQGLLKKESHLSLVDTFGGLSEEATSLQSLFQEVAGLRGRVSQIKEKARERALQIEFLRFQVNEIDAASLGDGEKQAIEEERAILLNATKLREFAEGAYALLYDFEGSGIEKISKAATYVKDMARIDRSAEESLSLLESALPLVEDASASLRKLRDVYEVDPGRLADLDDRLELIKKLEKKYGEGIEGILRHRDAALAELQGLEHAEEQGDEYERELAAAESGLAVFAGELSKKRRTAAGLMSKLVVQELRELGFQKADFRVDIKKRSEVGPSGIDDIEFLFSANPGEPPKPLSKVASGGELSRIMLALKCLEIGKREIAGRKSAGHKAGGDAHHSPSAGTLIFDEVDAGIGGVTAQHVGNRLHLLAEKYQVLCITHLPQIAALADCHLSVEKVLSEKEVKVCIEVLAGEKRREELARMLGGKVTDRSLRHAEEMLGIDE